MGEYTLEELCGCEAGTVYDLNHTKMCHGVQLLFSINGGVKVWYWQLMSDGDNLHDGDRSTYVYDRENHITGSCRHFNKMPGSSIDERKFWDPYAPREDESDGMSNDRKATLWMLHALVDDPDLIDKLREEHRVALARHLMT